MDDTRRKLIAHALNELPADEARELEARLATDDALRAEHTRLVYTVAAAHAVPVDDVSEEAIRRLLAAALEPVARAEPDNIIRLGWSRHLIARVAAAAVIAVVLGVAVMLTPDAKLSPTVAHVTDAQGKSVVLDGELVESRPGAPRTITFPTGEVLLDGASAVRVYSTGKYTPPRFEVERGRMVMTASGHDMNVSVAGNDVVLERGGMLAVAYDRAYANVAKDGSLVEVQRMPIGEVAALADQAYGLKLDMKDVPDSIRRRRVTFYGSELSKDEFLDSFVASAAQFGVELGADRNRLTYQPRSARVVPNEEWALEIALLEGRARLTGGEQTLDMHGNDALNMVSASAASPERLEARQLEPRALNETVVWAATTGRALGGRLDDVRPSAESLPGGTVIHTDALVLRGDMGKRIFKLDGPEFDFPLPGGRQGRLVHLLSNGAVFEVKGEVHREFVPFGRQSE